MKLEFTPESINDLNRLRQFLIDAESAYVKRMADDIIQGLQKLKEFPRIGLAVQRAPDPDVLRDLYIGQYCVRYLIGNNVIYILRIWHGKEDERNHPS